MAKNIAKNSIFRRHPVFLVLVLMSFAFALVIIIATHTHTHTPARPVNNRSGRDDEEVPLPVTVAITADPVIQRGAWFLRLTDVALVIAGAILAVMIAQGLQFLHVI